jgi:alkylated DNA nucleotide flippase Atl1
VVVKRNATRRERLQGGRSTAQRILCVAGLVARGEWTTYGDVAWAAGGRSARLVGSLAAQHPDFPNAHRVLDAGGHVRRPTVPQSSASRVRLEAEGVRFHGTVADRERRVSWTDLRGRLAERCPA